MEARALPTPAPEAGADSHAPPTGGPVTAAPPRTSTTPPPRSRRKHFIIAGVIVAAICVTSVLFYVSRKPRRPTEDECRNAILALYRDLNWNIEDMTFRVPIYESVASCVKSGSLDDVQCYTKSTAPSRECSGLDGVELENLEQGLFCFDVVDNETGVRRAGECAFSWQRCDGRRDDASFLARGKTFEACKKHPALFGIRSLDKEGSWYNLTPSLAECYARWRVSKSRLVNVSPGCHKVGPDAQDLGAVDEPPRDQPAPLSPSPGGYYCYDSYQMTFCTASGDECKAGAARNPYSECVRKKAVYFYAIDGTVSRLFATEADCRVEADRKWTSGENATTCARTP